MAAAGEVTFWLMTLLIGISACYLLMPLLIRFQQKFAAHPDLHALDFESLPPSVAQFLMTRTKGVFDLGFGEPTMIQTRSSAHVSAYFIMLLNRQTGDKAFVSCVMASSALQAFSVEFSTRFDSGEVFDTHNLKDPLPFPPGPTQMRTQVPMVTDLHELYDLHHFVIDQHAVRGQKILFKPGEALDYLARYTFQVPYEEKAARGWMYYDQKNDLYRLTLKGAYRMTWGLMQPFKAIRRMALNRRARKTVEKFERAGSASTRPAALAVPREMTEIVATPQEVVRDPQLQHAVSVLPTDELQSQTLEQLQQAALQQNSQAEHAHELAQIERLQKAQSSWGSALLVLAVSLVLFLTAGAASWSIRFAVLLVPILLFHELGHFLAMRVFKYRNLRMFFIPFLGAAVSGQHYNVPGWKKALVSLLGPVPGILCAPVLGVTGILLDQKILIEIALLMLILNGFNLLPILPLDGGWVLHAILFSRHYLLDGAFRLLASCLLAAGGVVLHDRFLVFLGVFLLFSLPLSYRLGKVARRLRNRIPSRSSDDQSIPADTACLILDELKTSLPKAANAQTRARCTLQVFEALNTRPPGWLATLGLATVHVGSLLLALVLSAVFVLAQHGNLRPVVEQAARMPKHGLEPGAMQGWRGPALKEQTPWTPLTIGATFAAQEQAAATFEQLTHELPDRSALRLFGQTLLIELPADDEPARAQWVKRLEALTPNVFVQTTALQVPLNLVCIAPDAAMAQAIVAESNAYFTLSRQALLIPPWSKAQRLSDQQRKARKTYDRLVREAQTLDAGELRKLTEAMIQAQRRGDQQEIRALGDKYRLITEEKRRRHMQQMKEEGPDAVDVQIIDLYAQRFGPSAPGHADPALIRDKEEQAKLLAERGRLFQKWQLQLGEHMGQLPSVNGQPMPGADRFSCSHGLATHTGLLVRFDGMPFVRPAEGGPALVAWLRQHRCSGFKYDFESPANVPEDE